MAAAFFLLAGTGVLYIIEMLLYFMGVRWYYSWGVLVYKKEIPVSLDAICGMVSILNDSGSTIYFRKTSLGLFLRGNVRDISIRSSVVVLMVPCYYVTVFVALFLGAILFTNKYGLCPEIIGYWAIMLGTVAYTGFAIMALGKGMANLGKT